MKTYWTANLKPRVLKTLAAANITGEASKHILKFEKTVNTLWTMKMNGTQWETLWNSTQLLLATDLMEDLNGCGLIDRDNPPKYFEEWKRYCEVKGICYDANLGDWLA